MTKTIRNALLSIVSIMCFSLYNTAYSQLCEEAVLPPAVIDGITVTSSWTGYVTTYPLAWSSCGYTTPVNSLHMGSAGVFAYTFFFSEPVNNVVFFMTATGIGVDEVFTITTDAGIPDITDLGSCFTTIAGNVISSGALAGPDGGGGAFEVDCPFGAYTSFTISGPGGAAGSLFALCENSIAPDPPTFIITDVSCFGECDGTATVEDGVDGPYTYAWDAESGGGATATATDLCAGTYTVEVTGVSGEMTELEVTIEEPDELVGSIISQSNVTCFGDTDGAVEIGAIGGTGDYTYDIGDGPVPSADFTDLAAGIYTVTILDENGCSAIVDIEITSPAELVLSEVAAIDLTCFESGDGSIEVMATGGTGPYNYSIDGGFFGAATIFNSLDAGSHTIIVSDNNGCEHSIDIVLTEPAEITATETAIGEVCLGDCTGSIELEVLTGEAPFTYSIDACGTMSPSGTYTDLCAADYPICIVDVNGCEYSTVVTVTEGTTEVDPTLNPLGPFCLTDDGVTITGVDLGTLTGPGVVGGTFNPSAAGVGTHTITNTFVGGCGGVGTLDIVVLALPNVSFTSDVNSGCEPVRVEFNATGTPGISCNWNFGDGGTSTSCGTAVHTYENDGEFDVTLTITDANGCTNSTTYYDYITVFPLPNANFSFMPHTVTTINPEVQFQELSTGEETWNWYFSDLGGSNEANPTFIFPEVEGDYPVTLIVESGHGCRDSITKIVRVNQEQIIYVPNAITPDGDTFNEVFKPYFSGVDIYNYHLTIHNRYGEVIFESYDLSVGWNGTYGGEIVQDGVYIWHIVTSELTTDKKLEFHGHVTVLR